METRLTKEIKYALREYNPAMNSQLRTIRWAEEVLVGEGYVDSIRFEDYVINENKKYICRKNKSEIIDIKNPNCKIKNTCVGCINKYSECTNKEIGILTTCFEIKITKSDFKSKNGHNFVGNHNYYVIPNELYPEIINLVPSDIGVILYYGHGSLRIKKKCKFKDIDQETLSKLLYNSMKKWVDNSKKCTFNYDKLRNVEIPIEYLNTMLAYIPLIDKDKLSKSDIKELKELKNKINYYIRK